MILPSKTQGKDSSLTVTNTWRVERKKEKETGASFYREGGEKKKAVSVEGKGRSREGRDGLTTATLRKTQRRVGGLGSVEGEKSRRGGGA